MLGMREIKFRGKTFEGEWIYGYPIKRCEETKILVNDWEDHPELTGNPIEDLSYEVEVIPETVGQFTSLKDKNGVEIYEGDKVKQNGFWICIVKYLEPKFCLKVINHDKGIRYHNFFHGRELCGNIDKNVEVIGKIHDK